MAIFKDEDDYRSFLNLLEVSAETYSVILHGFVLLKQHYHLLAETPLANLSEFMRHLNISYASAFNRRHRRRGHLYGGRFKSILFDEQHCLDRISAYLHLNPVKVGVIKRRNKDAKLLHLRNWKWSSLHGYGGSYPRYHFINHHRTLKPFGGDTPQGRKAYIAFVENQLAHGYLMKGEIVGQAIIGSREFIERVEHNVFDQKTDNPLQRYILQENILNELERGLRCTRRELLHAPGEVRSIAMDMLYRFGGMTNPAIGDLMGLDYTSISLGRKKIRRKRLSNQHLNARMTFVEKRLARMGKQTENSS